MKKCPYCAEEIQDEAIKCRYCGERLDTNPTKVDPGEQFKKQQVSQKDMNKCLNCGYERQPEDDKYGIIPLTECPKCGAIYDKMEAAITKEESSPKLSSHQSEGVTPVMEISGQESVRHSSLWNWKSFIVAVIIAAFLVAFVSAGLGVKNSRNIYWTALWIYLTIESWKYWKWKALLPYPIFLLACVIIIHSVLNNCA